MKLRHLLACMSVGCLIFSCGGNYSPEEAASQAAKDYYGQLLSGQYEHFIDGRAGIDSLPELYRQQLIVAAQQFITQQQRDHGGILDVRVSNARADSSLQLMQVFLVLCFADSTNEEIVVPMVESHGEWRMK